MMADGKHTREKGEHAARCVEATHTLLRGAKVLTVGAGVGMAVISSGHGSLGSMAFAFGVGGALAEYFNARELLRE